MVAMTGDGVNDALALKKADVGVAMGQRGSAVAREAADLVLLDDDFSTIVTAVREGRALYANIQSFLTFLFATNLAEVLTVLLGTAALAVAFEGGPPLVALTAVQILWVNLITDSLPALALALDVHPGVLNRPPRRPEAPLLARRELAFAALGGGGLALVCLGAGATAVALGEAPEAARTVVFLVLVGAQMFYPWAARSLHGRLAANPTLIAAAGVCLGLQVLAIGLPTLRTALALTPPTLQLVGIALLFVALGGLVARAAARVARR